MNAVLEAVITSQIPSSGQIFLLRGFWDNDLALLKRAYSSSRL